MKSFWGFFIIQFRFYMDCYITLALLFVTLLTCSCLYMFADLF